MTENEAIKEIKYWLNVYAGSRIAPEMVQATGMAIKALEEVQQYREIGKVSTCRNAVEICRAMIERGIEPDNIKEYITFEDNLVQRGYDLKRLLEIMEQQTAKKAITYRGTNRADCPVCGATVRGIGTPFGNWCSKCGQHLDWGERNERRT